jgi:hypothetical protein
MYSNFIFNYIENRERETEERLKKENSKPEHSLLILDIAMITLILNEWHGARNRPRYLFIYLLATAFG